MLAEAAAAADERVLQDLKKFAFFRAPWRAASASAARFFAALAAVLRHVRLAGVVARALRGLQRLRLRRDGLVRADSSHSSLTIQYS